MQYCIPKLEVNISLSAAHLLAFKLQNSICPSKNSDLTRVFAHFTLKRDICTKPQASVNFLQNSMAANLTLFALNNENRISFGCNFELYMIVLKARLRMKMMLIALVPDSICLNKVAAAVVGPRSQNRTVATLPKRITVMRSRDGCR